MLSAAAQVAYDLGAGKVSVTAVVERSGVSRRTFYEVFHDREDCMLAVFEEALARAAERVLPAWRRHAGDWCEAIRVGLAAFLEFLEDEPLLGSFLLVDSLGGGGGVLRRRADVMELLVEAVNGGRALARNPDSVSRVHAEGLVGAVLAILYTRLARDAVGREISRDAAAGLATAPHARPSARRELDPGAMTGLLGQLTGILVLPYLGPAAAAKQSALQVAPKSIAKPTALAADAAMGLPIRLTYRTVTVLRAIAELGATNAAEVSNSQVAEAAGVSDPGQISKLLARLARAGLIENVGGNRARGEANAWQLTSKGAALEQTLRGRTVARPRR